MTELYNYLKDCKTFYLATIEDQQPRVRPFGAICEFENKLYMVTNNKKPVFRQLMDNPQIEISGMAKGTWLRLTAKAIQDNRIEARQKMLEENPSIAGMYAADDGIMEVFYLTEGTGTVYAFNSEPVTYTLD